MTRQRRPARRQGVIYGPVRAAEPGPGAGIFGRLLGGLVILGALVLLAGGSYAYLGRSPAAGASPSPTSGAASPTASASPTPTLAPTVAPTPNLTATPTLPPAPSPTPFAIEVRQGPGAITFGTQFSGATLRITDPHTTFAPTGRFVWSAQLTEAAGAPELRIVLNAYDPLTGTETLISDVIEEIDNPQATISVRRRQMQRLVPGPGIYVLRYLRGDILLAEGYFGVTDE